MGRFQSLQALWNITKEFFELDSKLPCEKFYYTRTPKKLFLNCNYNRGSQTQLPDELDEIGPPDAIDMSPILGSVVGVNFFYNNTTPSGFPPK